MEPSVLSIRLEKVKKVYPPAVVAVEETSFEVRQGQLVCLIGTSGSGKTTTLKMINRLIEPSSGTIWLDDEDVTGLDLLKLRKRFGYVIQKGGLFPHMTVAQNVGLPNRLEGWDEARSAERVKELLQTVNLPPQDYAHRYPGELSGGQQQRVGVARALALDPAYILMDEPFGALDPITRNQVQEEFLRLVRHMGKTVVLVTHDMDEAFKLSDHIVVMDGGAVVQQGSPAEIREQPATAFVSDLLRSANLR